MKSIYLKSILISTLLTSNVALAGGSQQLNFEDLFLPEFPHVAQSTPANADQIQRVGIIDSENVYARAKQSIRKPKSRKSSRIDWEPFLMTIDMNLDKGIFGIMEIIWPDLNESQQMHFDNDPTSKKFYFCIRRQVLKIVNLENVQPQLAEDNMASPAPQILPQQVMPIVENRDIFIWTPEMSAILNRYLSSDDQRSHPPKMQPQQMELPLENDQLPGDFMLQLPEFPLESPTAVQPDAATRNQGEPLFLDAEAMAALTRMIDAINESPEEDPTLPQLSLHTPQMEAPLTIATKKKRLSPKGLARTNFDWAPFQHLVEATLSMGMPEAMTIIWAQMDDEQQNHFNKNPSKKAFYNCLLHKRKRVKAKNMSQSDV